MGRWAHGQTNEIDFIGRYPINVERPKSEALHKKISKQTNKLAQGISWGFTFWVWKPRNTRNHSFSSHSKFPEKITFLAPCYTHLRVSGGKKCLFFRKLCVRTKWMIPNQYQKNRDNIYILNVKFVQTNMRYFLLRFNNELKLLTSV